MLLVMLLALLAAPAAALDCAPTLHGFPSEYVVTTATDTACTYRRPDGQRVTVAYPVPDDPTSTVPDTSDDGFVFGQSTFYTTARTNATGVGQPLTAPGFYVGQLSDTTGTNSTYTFFYVERGYIAFDLSGITAGATITSETLRMTTSKAADYAVGSNEWQLIVREFSWTVPLGADIQGNYQNCMAADGTQDVVWQSSSAMTPLTSLSTTLNDFTWLKIGAGAQLTQFCLFSTRDQAQIAPPGLNTSERVFIDSNESGGGAPVLTIVWNTGPTPTVTSTQTPTSTPTVRITPTRMPCFDGSPGPNCTPPRCGEPLPQ